MGTSSEALLVQLMVRQIRAGFDSVASSLKDTWLVMVLTLVKIVSSRSTSHFIQFPETVNHRWQGDWVQENQDKHRQILAIQTGESEVWRSVHWENKYCLVNRGHSS